MARCAMVGVVLSFLIGGLVSLWLILSKRASSSSRIAFGPFLLVGSSAALIFS